MVFVRHPLVKLVTLFYLKEKRMVIFVTKLPGPCRQSTIHEPFFNPDLEEEDLTDLLTLFDNKDSLGEVRLKFTAKRGRSLEKKEFDEIVWLLGKNRIIMNAEVFYGTLEGTHRT